MLLCEAASLRSTSYDKYVRPKIMETAELKSAISDLLARIEKIRDWL
jgi:hypothetical protein